MSRRVLSFSAWISSRACSRILAASSSAFALAPATIFSPASEASRSIRLCSSFVFSISSSCSRARPSRRCCASSALRKDSSIRALRLSTIEVMTGKPNFASMNRTMPKISVIQTSRPKSGVIRDIAYFEMRQTRIANRQAPSMRALMMMAVIR